jgi:hypothetical protein
MQAVRQLWSFDERDEPGGAGIHFSKQFSLILCLFFKGKKIICCLVSQVPNQEGDIGRGDRGLRINAI